MGRVAAADALLLLLTFALVPARALNAGDCFQFGSGGWEIVGWGQPHVRLPPGKNGTIPICGTGFGFVVFRWKQPAGVFQIPSDQCPGSFDGPYNDTFRELAPVSNSTVPPGFSWAVPTQPGWYYATSQVPGACEAGIIAKVQVVGPASSGGTAARWQRQRQAARAWLAALLATALLLPG